MEGKENTNSEVGSSVDKDGDSVARIDERKRPTVFWPRDLLPLMREDARIITWGCDSRVTKGYSGSANKNTIIQHGKDLVLGLARERDFDRPIIWVTNSLGGIIVKQLWELSSKVRGNSNAPSHVYDRDFARLFSTKTRKSTDRRTFLNQPQQSFSWEYLMEEVDMPA